MKKPTQTEVILGTLLIANILVSLWLYQAVTTQGKRIQALERDDAIKQQVDNLGKKYESLKDRVQGFFK
jgi:hypothetical protein